jgi:hypothetical protein
VHIIKISLFRRFKKTTKVGSLHSWVRSELNDRDENTNSDLQNTNSDLQNTNSDLQNLQNSGRFVLKLVAPPSSSVILGKQNATLAEYEISSDTLLVLEND